MKSKKLIVMLSIIMIGLIGLSISFSLAWYASATRLNVEAIQLELEGDRELLISTSDDKDSFKQKVERGKDNLQEIDMFKPVSTMYSHIWMDEKSDTPEFRDSSSTLRDSQGVPIMPSKENYGFFSQEFYLMANDDVYVSVDKETSIFQANEAANRAWVEKNAKRFAGRDKEQLIEELNSLINCLRISILVPDEECYSYTIIDPAKNGETLMGGVLDNSSDGYYDFYGATDGNSYEILYGEVENREKAVFDEPLANDSIISGASSAFNAKTRKNVRKFNYEKSVENGLIIPKENSVTLDEIQGLESKLQIPLYRDTPRKIVLSIYLEGWDLDCINTTMGGNFISDISFKIVREMAL